MIFSEADDLVAIFIELVTIDINEITCIKICFQSEVKWFEGVQIGLNWIWSFNLKTRVIKSQWQWLSDKNTAKISLLLHYLLNALLYELKMLFCI